MDLAKIGDKIACNCKGGPHRIVTGASTVFVDDVPVARVGDKSSCGAAIVSGADWFEVEDRPAAINGSQTSCGGRVIAVSSASTGSPMSIDIGGFRFQQAPSMAATEARPADRAIPGPPGVAPEKPQQTLARSARQAPAQGSNEAAPSAIATAQAQSATNAVEPGFHVVRRPMSSQALKAELLGQAPPAVREKFRALNPHLAQGARPGQMALLSDPDNLMCTAEDALLADAAARVDAALTALDDDEARFMVEHYDALAPFLDYSSAGVGASTAMVGQHLSNVERTLIEIERLHQRSFARHGHLNSPDFFARRRRLFTQLDNAMGALVKRGTGFPDHPSLRHSLGISTRSLTHHWRHAGVGDIPGYATHIEGIARASKYIKAGGWIGVGLGGVGAYAKVQEVCASGREEECSRVKYQESGKFVGGVGGGLAASAGAGFVAGTACAAIGIATGGLGGIACGLIVVGSAGIIGGAIGSSRGERFGEMVYESTAP